MTNFADGATKYFGVLLGEFAKEATGQESSLRQGVVDLVMMELELDQCAPPTFDKLKKVAADLCKKPQDMLAKLIKTYGGHQNFGVVFTADRYDAFVSHVRLVADQLAVTPVIVDHLGRELLVIESAESILDRLHTPASRTPPHALQCGRSLIVLAR